MSVISTVDSRPVGVLKVSAECPVTAARRVRCAAASSHAGPWPGSWERSAVQITVVTTTTPDGGWVRSTRLSSTTEDFALAHLERLAAVPAADHTHALLPAPVQGHPTFIAIAPDAATAVLVTADGQVRDTATIKNGLAVLTSRQDPPDATFRLRLLAPDGHTVYDQIPPTSDELLD